ncbi:beta-N-acetylhexosaminidase [Shimia marina]|uniref:beta-N-acetylhexosaminidase n=1 Tax=Shimia marina TaxID=321267 RepID=A0A0P1EP34_9RHOB|nr:beta-N-acetylhexosaminidase [Shimia marina]CUH51928.1 Beta-hexosaminidase [Shimia marina]SFE45451.1 beta-N-acetylhexosaminidase [Shimia marina]
MSGFCAAIFGCDGLRLSEEEKQFFKDVQPFGFILFARNIDTADQVKALCAELRATVGHEAPILIDQEGGRVQRLRAPLVRDWLPPLEQVMQAGEKAERAMYLRYRLIAHELMALGIDANCAPMVDVARDETHPFLKNRCYGADPASVARIGRAVAEGLWDGGVYPILKHMPGHGRAVVDSHKEPPRVTESQADLEGDFAPFRALNDMPMGMTAHIVFEALDDRPATISDKMMRFMRDDIGFGGLIMTDDIGMEALNGTVDQRAKAAIEAGCDVILHCNGSLAERKAVAEAIGAMTPAAQARSEAVLAARRAPKPVDIEALAEELKAL